MSVIANKHFVDIVLFKRKDEESVIVYDKKERDYQEEARVRAFRKCVEYGLNNDWQYFITITLDDRKVDSDNYDCVISQILKEFVKIRKYYDKDFKYLLVPELSPKHNRLHFHGLVAFGKLLEQLKADGEIKYLGFNNFNPRARKERDYYIAAYLGKSNHFNPRARKERDENRYNY